jgi:hypothetical protein
MGRGWRHAIWRAVFVFGEEGRKDFNTESAEGSQSAQRKEQKRRGERKACGVGL